MLFIDAALVTGTTITMPPETAGWGAGFNQRTAAHELEHGMGLAENKTVCSTTDSLMRPVVCNANPVYFPTTPTASDSMPVGKTTYGTTPAAACPAS